MTPIWFVAVADRNRHGVIGKATKHTFYDKQEAEQMAARSKGPTREVVMWEAREEAA